MESQSGFQYLVQMVSDLMKNQHYEEIISLINKQIDNQNLPKYIEIELRSMLGLTLYHLNKCQQANQQFDKVLMKNPLHYLTLKRKANLLQKMEQFQTALQTYKKASNLDIQNKSIKNKIKRISIKLQSLDINNQKYNKQKQQQEKPTGVVSFGSFEVIEFQNDESDAHLAIIKNQINKLSEKKPKKSILKDNGSSSKYSSSQSVKSVKVATTLTFSDEKKQQNEYPSQKNVQISLKSNQIINQPIIKKSLSVASVQGKKKKSKSVSFGNDSTFD